MKKKKKKKYYLLYFMVLPWQGTHLVYVQTKSKRQFVSPEETDIVNLIYSSLESLCSQA